MELSMSSEIGQLREVLVHAPGPEVDNMPPTLMHELLFDDIIYGTRARYEHSRFCAIMRAAGVEVHDVADVLVQALERAPREEIRWLIETVARLEDLGGATVEKLSRLGPAPLAAALICGVPNASANPASAAERDLFHLDPVPNLLFSRDAQTVLGSRVIFSAMNRGARKREPLLSRFAFEHGFDISSDSILIDFLREPGGRRPRRRPISTIEGGDVLVLHEGVVVVGVSERTSESAVDLLAERLRRIGEFHALVMVPMPRTRSAMHLDTIFTRTSREECLVYAPMILPSQSETLSALTVDLRKPDDYGTRRPDLLSALRELGIDLEPIACGGAHDYVRQAREQWTDGANSFAVAPGVVFLYERNEATTVELARRGYEVISARDMKFSEDGRCLYTFAEDKKYAFLIAGEELSRARGGPRCMAMPLRRDPLS